MAYTDKFVIINRTLAKKLKKNDADALTHLLAVMSIHAQDITLIVIKFVPLTLADFFRLILVPCQV